MELLERVGRLVRTFDLPLEEFDHAVSVRLPESLCFRIVKLCLDLSEDIRFSR